MIHTKTSCHPMNVTFLPSGKTFTKTLVSKKHFNKQIIGSSIWTDGTNIYCSGGPSSQLVLNGDTWEKKIWNGLTNFGGSLIWTDGTNIYYSNEFDSNYEIGQYVLNKDTSTWEVKTWNGLTTFAGDYVWTDGTNIYYSYSSSQYVLNKDTSTWEEKTWNGISGLYGNHIWSDGSNIYYSRSSSEQYVLNGDTWEAKFWVGLTGFNADGRIWTDGKNIYRTNGGETHFLEGDSWQEMLWEGRAPFYGQDVWTDGKNIYCDHDTILLPTTAKFYSCANSGIWMQTRDLSEATIIKVTELPSSEIDVKAFYKCNGKLYRYEPNRSSVRGTWVFNSTIDFSILFGEQSSPPYGTELSFSSDGTEYIRIAFMPNSQEVWYYKSSSTNQVPYKQVAWTSTANRKITIAKEPDDAAFIKCLKANAKQIEYAREWVEYTPSGEDKTVVTEPIQISTEVEMNAILENATADSIETIYRYVGESTNTYENNGLYIVGWSK